MGKKKTAATQDEARKARYSLLEGWCEKNSVLHLLLGHTSGDQLETIIMRHRKNSRSDGLAGMSGVVERMHCRILRPLLHTSRSELRSFLTDNGQEWLEDPSNEDLNFERIRLRKEISKIIISDRKIQKISRNLAKARREREQKKARIIASTFSLDPLGFGIINKNFFLHLSDEIGIPVLSQLISTIGGLAYAPSNSKVESMFYFLKRGLGKKRTLGRCVFLEGETEFILKREIRNLPLPIQVVPGQRIFWDNRFLLKFSGTGGTSTLRPLMGVDLKRISKVCSPRIKKNVLSEVIQTLPALYYQKEFYCLPEWAIIKMCNKKSDSKDCVEFDMAVFRPIKSLSGSGFHLIK